VRSFGGGPQSRAEIATAAASAVVPTSPGPLRASPRPLVPSLSGLPRSAEKEREASPPPPPATAAGSVASPGPSKKESPRKLERKETLSPRRLLEGAKARALRMRGGTAGSAGGEGDKGEMSKLSCVETSFLLLSFCSVRLFFCCRRFSL
jgi:hypothetical protein